MFTKLDLAKDVILKNSDTLKHKQSCYYENRGYANDLC